MAATEELAAAPAGPKSKTRNNDNMLVDVFGLRLNGPAAVAGEDGLD